MKTALTCILFVVTIIYAHADIMVLGDSHTVGPFGKYLQQDLAQKFPEQVITTYAHSSSAPIHWWDDKIYKLTGGVSHRMSYQGKTYYHPGLPDWRVPYSVQKIMPVLDQVLIHSHWREVAPIRRPDVIVFALGANDKRAVTTRDGVRTSEFAKRQVILDELLKEVESRGIKCLWVAPPSSSKRTQAQEQTTHEYLMGVIQNRCSLYDSRKFRAIYCDKVHFNCQRAFKTAEAWAQEVAEFISDNL